MSYPFGWNPPSLGDFVKTCTEKFGAELRELQTDIEGDFGKVKPRVLVINDKGGERHVVLPNVSDDVLQEAMIVAHWCRRLGIPTTDFGFEFDYDAGTVDIGNS